MQKLCGNCGPNKTGRDRKNGWAFQTKSAHRWCAAGAAARRCCSPPAARHSPASEPPQAFPASERAVYAAVGEPTRAPIGWTEFCLAYKPECDTKPSAPRDIVLSPKVWSDLVKVNDWVNRSVEPLTDLEHWGVVERWNYPDDG